MKEYIVQSGDNYDYWDLVMFQDGKKLKELIRCKDCKWGKEVCGNIECWADMNLPPEYHGYDWYCPNGERKEE